MPALPGLTFDMPPIDDWEAFQAWLKRQMEPAGEARTLVPSTTPAQVVSSPSPNDIPSITVPQDVNSILQEIQNRTEQELVAGTLPDLQHEQVQKAIPEDVDPWTRGGLLPLATRKNTNPPSLSEVITEVARGTAGAVNPFANLIPPSKNVAFPAMPSWMKTAEDVVSGKAPTHAVDPVTGETQLSPEIQEAGEGLATLSMTGGLVGTGAKATLRGPRVNKWIEENPRAKVVEEPKPAINLIPEEGVLGSTGVLKGKTVTEYPTAYYHTKVEEKFNVNGEDLFVMYNIADRRLGGSTASIDFSVIETMRADGASMRFIKPIAGKATTPAQGRDTLFTVAASVEKFVQQTKPERVSFLAGDDKLIPVYDAFARSLARKYEGRVIERPIEGGMATIEFPKNKGTAFNPNTLKSGLPELIPLLTAPYAISYAVKAARHYWPKTSIRVGELLDPHGDLGPPTLMNYDRPKDLVNAFTNGPVGAMFSYIKGLGFDNKAFFHEFEMNSGPAETRKVMNAIESGRMVSSAGDYIVPNGMSAARVTALVRSLPQAQQKLANDYVNLNDVLRRMNLTGATTGAGKSRVQIRREITAIENQFPEVKEIKKNFGLVVDETLRFAADGQDAILTSKQFSELHGKGFAIFESESVAAGGSMGKRISERAHAFGNKVDVSPAVMDRKLGLSTSPRVDAFESLPRWTEMMLRAQIKNSQKNKMRRALESTGKDVILPVTKKQLDKHPDWESRITRMRQHGELKRYISSQFVTDMIRFDSHVATSPWLFATARAFQWGTTGYGRPEFALFQFLRETVLAPLSTPPGMKGIGVTPFTAVPRATAALFEQFARKEQKIVADELYRLLDSGSGGVLRMMLGGDEQAMRSIAQRLTKSYFDSHYYNWESRGGGGISMARNPIDSAKGAWNEVSRNAQFPHTRLMADTYINMLDALQNASRYAFDKVNYKASKKAGKLTQARMDEITRESRHLTGELMTSGQAYTSKGKLYSADYPKKGTNIPVPYYGRSIETLRQSTVWVNAILKGTERIMRAYWENPVKFTSYMYTGVFLPLTLTYMWAAYRGPEYLDYLVNGRSELEKSTSLYFPPLDENAKPEDGWTLSMFPPEINGLVYGYFNMLHGMVNDMSDNAVDFGSFAQNVLKNQFGIVVPPLWGAGAGALGVDIPSSFPSFGEEVHSVKDNPYSVFHGNVEAMLKAIFGSTTDSFIAMGNTLYDGGSVTDAVKEFAYRRKRGLPIKDVQLHSFTELSQKYWDRLDKITLMDDVYKQHISKHGTITEKEMGDIVGYGPEFKLIPEMKVKLNKDGRPNKKGTMIPTEKPEGVYLRDMTINRLGRPEVPPPTNPQYVMLVKKVHDIFASKSNNYSKAVSRLKNVTTQIQDLKRENMATLKDIKARIDAMPDESKTKQEMLQFNWNERDSVRKAINYFEKERRATYHIVNRIVAEAEMQIGVKLDDLDPYKMPDTLSIGIGAD